MTVVESAAGAVLPWNSIDAGEPLLSRLPQQNIDVCLCCPYHADACDKCNGNGTLKREKAGRPAKQIDTELFLEMLRLKKTNRELCAYFGVSRTKIIKEKNKLLREVSA